MKITAFVDVTDPWSYIGATRCERAAAMLTILTGEAVETVYRAHRLGERVDPETAVPAARISGIDLNLEERVEADGADAWRLLTWAAESGPGVQRDLLHQLWRAHFLEGSDIDDRFVLASRAALVGLDLETADALLASGEYAETVEEQHATSLALGLGALPAFVVDGEWTITGVHSQDDYLQALNRIRAERDS